MSNRTPLTGLPLEQPDPAPRRIHVTWEMDYPCITHFAPYTGTIPCTGVLRCVYCGTEWDPDTGKLLPPRRTP